MKTSTSWAFSFNHQASGDDGIWVELLSVELEVGGWRKKVGVWREKIFIGLARGAATPKRRTDESSGLRSLNPLLDS
jgi:hypothetical protein